MADSAPHLFVSLEGIHNIAMFRTIWVDFGLVKGDLTSKTALEVICSFALSRTFEA